MYYIRNPRRPCPNSVISGRPPELREGGSKGRVGGRARVRRLTRPSRFRVRAGAELTRWWRRMFVIIATQGTKDLGWLVVRATGLCTRFNSRSTLIHPRRFQIAGARPTMTSSMRLERVWRFGPRARTLAKATETAQEVRNFSVTWGGGKN